MDPCVRLVVAGIAPFRPPWQLRFLAITHGRAARSERVVLRLVRLVLVRVRLVAIPCERACGRSAAGTLCAACAFRAFRSPQGRNAHAARRGDAETGMRRGLGDGDTALPLRADSGGPAQSRRDPPAAIGGRPGGDRWRQIIDIRLGWPRRRAPFAAAVRVVPIRVG